MLVDFDGGLDVSADQPPPDGTLSVDDVDRLAERFKPAWEVDDRDSGSGALPSDDTATVRSTRTPDTALRAASVAASSGSEFSEVVPPTDAGPLVAGETIASSHTQHVQSDVSLTPSVPVSRSREAATERHQTPTHASRTHSSTPATYTPTEGRSAVETTGSSAPAEPAGLLSEDDGDVVDFGVTRGRWKTRHIVPVVVALGAGSLGLLLLLRQPSRSLEQRLETLQAAPAHMAPEPAPAVATSAAPSMAEPNTGIAGPVGNATGAGSENEAPSDSTRLRPATSASSAATEAHSATPASSGAAAARAAKAREPAPSSTVFLHRPPATAPTQKPSAPQQKAAPLTKPGGIVREVPF